jgi:hypothetical protein
MENIGKYIKEIFEHHLSGDSFEKNDSFTSFAHELYWM